MIELEDSAREQLETTPGVDLERLKLEEILGSLKDRDPVIVRFNEKLEVGRQVNSALEKASEDERNEALGKILDLIYKGPSGEESLIRSFYLHFMMTVNPEGSELLSLGAKNLSLAVAWTKVPKISQICDPFFRGEFEANGLLYILGSQLAIERYICIICKKFWLSLTFEESDTKIYFPH